MITKLDETTQTPSFENSQKTWRRAQTWISQHGGFYFWFMFNLKLQDRYDAAKCLLQTFDTFVHMIKKLSFGLYCLGLFNLNVLMWGGKYEMLREVLKRLNMGGAGVHRKLKSVGVA